MDLARVGTIKKVIHHEKIFVTWIKTHYGHAQELQHLRLQKGDRSAVALKLIVGVALSR